MRNVALRRTGDMKGIWGLGAEVGGRQEAGRCSGLWAGPFCKPEVEESWACEAAGTGIDPLRQGF